MFGIYQYAFVALAFLVGRPFRKSFYTNTWFTTYFAIYMVFNIMMTFNPFDWTFMYNQVNWAAEIPIPKFWQWYIFILAMINSAVTVFWERVVVKYVAIRSKEMYDVENNRRRTILKGRRKSKLHHGSNAGQISLIPVSSDQRN